MSWEGSDRRARLPANWSQLVVTVRRRAATFMFPQGQCESIRSKSGKRCIKAGQDVDHIVPGDDHRPSNLQLLCYWHHSRKTALEGNAAKAARRGLAARPLEKHPGARL